MPQKRVSVKCSLLQDDYILQFLATGWGSGVLQIDPDEAPRLKRVGATHGGKVVSADLDVESGLWELVIETE